jgi:uncharacterized OB-fold protein
MTDGPDRPLPAPDSDSLRYWESLRRHELSLQRCRECGKFRFPPTKSCPTCLSGQSEWSPVSGRGVVYSYTTVTHSVVPGWSKFAPYTVVLVRPEEIPESDVRVRVNTATNLIAGDYVDSRIREVFSGLAVTASFVDIDADTSLLRWQAALL